MASTVDNRSRLAPKMSREEMKEFHQSIFVANLHHDFSLEIHRRREAAAERAVMDRLYYPKLAEGGVDFEFYTVGGDDVEFTRDPDLIRGTLRGIDHAWQEVRESNHFEICLNTQDVLRASARGKKALMLTIEGADPLGEDLALLRNYYRLGLRSVILTWFKGNRAGDGVGEKRNGGLSNFGREAVAEMNRLGILIDVSQCGPRTMEDVFATTTKPVMASHSNAAGLYSHRRNLTDEQLKQLRATGGVIGLTSYPAHVGKGLVGVEDLLNHVDYVVDLIGIDHVALGLNIIVQDKKGAEGFFERSNIEYSDLWMPGLEDIDRMFVVTTGLLERGYTREDVAKIMGGNVLRLLKETVG